MISYLERPCSGLQPSQGVRDFRKVWREEGGDAAWCALRPDQGLSAKAGADCGCLGICIPPGSTMAGG